MFKKVFIMMVILIAVAAVLPAQAQVEPTAAECNVETLKEGYIETLESMTTMGDIYLLQREMAFDLSKCLGWLFEDTEQAAIGPITFIGGNSATAYRAIFTTDGYGIVKTTAIEGECRGSSSTLFNVGRGDADDGAEAFFIVEGDNCVVLIEVTNVEGEWQLIFEPL